MTRRPLPARLRAWHLVAGTVLLAVLAAGSLFVGVSDLTPAGLLDGRPEEVRVLVDEAIDYFELGDLADRHLDQLSGGRRQRAYVAMVLCQDTDYVLLDEPLNNLDMRHAVHMMRRPRRMADDYGKTVVMVVHDINFASCHSDTILAMKDGSMIAQGTTADSHRPAGDRLRPAGADRTRHSPPGLTGGQTPPPSVR
ncbi:ATP-binding cassette domain-containing protein [Streptosporangium amethystogenes]|uniref:ATP-binding cassette domain-containing protein n=1 Tax=Streptosporangium amethystogenes TaxID=2002 RepID=UPI000A486BD3|nr:ATP-binding cassette domain-containing protein [Streptosporangium amethystogenes]